MEYRADLKGSKTSQLIPPEGGQREALVDSTSIPPYNPNITQAEYWRKPSIEYIEG